MESPQHAVVQLMQKGRITLGFLAASDGLTARELAAQLELPGTDELRGLWLGRSLGLGLGRQTGKTQATRYFAEPSF